ncbi:MAG: lysophospholipid acyltransferase family protein [Candidatus Binatia bacterium]
MQLVALKDCYYLSVIALVKTASWFPSPKLKEWVVRSVACIAYRSSSSKRRLSQKNLAAAFDGRLSERQLRRVVRRAFYEFWDDTFSLLPSRAGRAALKQADLCGVEHLRTALKNGKGVILWESRHFGRRTLAKQILHEHGFAIHQVHGWNHLGGFLGDSSTWVRRHVVERFFEKWEKQFVAEIICLPKSDSLAFTRALLERLQHNAIICIPADGGSGQKIIPIQFLGRTGAFSTGMVSLAKISGAAILPLFCFQESTGGTKVVIEAPVRVESNVDKERSLENSIFGYISLLEAYVRRYPEQYRNWHLLGSVEGMNRKQLSPQGRPRSS